MSGDDFGAALNRRAVWQVLACVVKLRQTHTTCMALYWRSQALKYVDELEAEEPELHTHLDRMGHDLMDDWVVEFEVEQTEGKEV